MDRRERLNDPIEAQRAALDGRQAEIWTALPGIVTAFDPDAITVSVQPAIAGSITGEDGVAQRVSLPLLVDVPVSFPMGGKFVLTFPVAAGDECIVVFSARCIDGWWQSGGVQAPAEHRMHDLSDGMAIVGIRSKARKLRDISTENVQLRSEDGLTYIEIGPEGKVRIDCEHLEQHARTSMSWDVDGYGERIESLGGGVYKTTTWQIGAAMTSETLPIHPPEGPEGEP